MLGGGELGGGGRGGELGAGGAGAGGAGAGAGAGAGESDVDYNLMVITTKDLDMINMHEIKRANSDTNFDVHKPPTLCETLASFR